LFVPLGKGRVRGRGLMQCGFILLQHCRITATLFAY